MNEYTIAYTFSGPKGHEEFLKDFAKGNVLIPGVQTLAITGQTAEEKVKNLLRGFGPWFMQNVQADGETLALSHLVKEYGDPQSVVAQFSIALKQYRSDWHRFSVQYLDEQLNKAAPTGKKIRMFESSHKVSIQFTKKLLYVVTAETKYSSVTCIEGQGKGASTYLFGQPPLEVVSEYSFSLANHPQAEEKKIRFRSNTYPYLLDEYFSRGRISPYLFAEWEKRLFFKNIALFAPAVKSQNASEAIHALFEAYSHAEAIASYAPDLWASHLSKELSGRALEDISGAFEKGDQTEWIDLIYAAISPVGVAWIGGQIPEKTNDSMVSSIAYLLDLVKKKLGMNKKLDEILSEPRDRKGKLEAEWCCMMVYRAYMRLDPALRSEGQILPDQDAELDSFLKSVEGNIAYLTKTYLDVFKDERFVKLSYYTISEIIQKLNRWKLPLIIRMMHQRVGLEKVTEGVSLTDAIQRMTGLQNQLMRRVDQAVLAINLKDILEQFTGRGRDSWSAWKAFEENLTSQLMLVGEREGLTASQRSESTLSSSQSFGVDPIEAVRDEYLRLRQMHRQRTYMSLEKFEGNAFHPLFDASFLLFSKIKNYGTTLSPVKLFEEIVEVWETLEIYTPLDKRDALIYEKNKLYFHILEQLREAKVNNLSEYTVKVDSVQLVSALNAAFELFNARVKGRYNDEILKKMGRGEIDQVIQEEIDCLRDANSKKMPIVVALFPESWECVTKTMAALMQSFTFLQKYAEKREHVEYFRVQMQMLAEEGFAKVPEAVHRSYSGLEGRLRELSGGSSDRK